MLYTFNIVPSLNVSTQPAASYFVQMTHDAQQALASSKVGMEEAWSLCEYLDAVDAGDLAMDKGVYSRCVGVLTGFLAERSTLREVRALGERSWAAHTLLAVLDNLRTPSPSELAA